MWYEVGVPELALNDVQRLALAGDFELERVSVTQLMRRLALVIQACTSHTAPS